MKSIAKVLIVSILLPMLGGAAATLASSDLPGTEDIDYQEPHSYVTLNSTELEHSIEARSHNIPAIEYRYWTSSGCSGTYRLNRVRDGICHDLDPGSARFVRFYGGSHTVRQHTGRQCIGNRRDTSSTSPSLTFAGPYKSFRVYCGT